MDKFSSMTDLLRSVSPQHNYIYSIERSHRSSIKIFAPHAGCIEPCTGPIALAIAGSELDCFVFSGIRDQDCFKILHVTSVHYDEPQCVEMAAESEVAIAFHGCTGDENFVCIGGNNRNLASNLLRFLTECGYTVRAVPAQMKGEDDRNFINYSRQGGIQLEMSAGFRRMLFPSFPKSSQRHPLEFARFIDSMRTWIRSVEPGQSQQSE